MSKIKLLYFITTLVIGVNLPRVLIDKKLFNELLSGKVAVERRFKIKLGRFKITKTYIPEVLRSSCQGKNKDKPIH